MACVASGWINQIEDGGREKCSLQRQVARQGIVKWVLISPSPSVLGGMLQGVITTLAADLNSTPNLALTPFSLKSRPTNETDGADL